jgi:hypothetical protein
MRIKLTAPVAAEFHAHRNLRVGDVVDVDDANGQRYVDAGAAVRVTAKKDEPAAGPADDDAGGDPAGAGGHAKPRKATAAQRRAAVESKAFGHKGGDDNGGDD